MVSALMIWGRKATEQGVRQVGMRSLILEHGGVLITIGSEPTPKSMAAAALLEQLADEGLAERADDGHRLNWSQLFVLLEDEEAAEELARLDLPSFTMAVPKIVSRNSLTDRDFSVAIDGWLDAERRPLSGARLKGGALEVDGSFELVTPSVWNLIERIRRFARRQEGERNEAEQRRAWGEIRKLAMAAGASLDDFLYRTVVLTPDRLQMAVRRSEGLGLVEVEPWFEGAPADWLEVFDKSSQVRGRYDLPTPDGIIQIMISPEVGTVLREVKRMPGRRVAGERAQAFLLNPIAALGPDAAAVVDEEQFEKAKQQAGIVFERFAAVTPEIHGEGALGLLITSGIGDAIETREIMLEEADVIEFVEGVERNLDRGLQLFAWDEYEFELDGDSRLHCEALRRALGRRQDGVITHGQVYDLSGYSERVEGIGQEKSFYSPQIAKRDDEEGWFPENLVPIIGWTNPGTDQPCILPLTDELSAELRSELEKAKGTGATSVHLTGCPTPIWADTAYRSKKNEAFLAKCMFTSHIHQKKPPRRPMPERIARANAKRSAIRSAVEHVFAGQKHRMGLIVRTIGIARARIKIGMANLAYNFQRLAWLEGRTAPA